MNNCHHPANCIMVFLKVLFKVHLRYLPTTPLNYKNTLIPKKYLNTFPNVHYTCVNRVHSTPTTLNYTPKPQTTELLLSTDTIYSYIIYYTPIINKLTFIFPFYLLFIIKYYCFIMIIIRKLIIL